MKKNILLILYAKCIKEVYEKNVIDILIIENKTRSTIPTFWELLV